MGKIIERLKRMGKITERLKRMVECKPSAHPKARP
jgi:hypothetical protein